MNGFAFKQLDKPPEPAPKILSQLPSIMEPQCMEAIQAQIMKMTIPTGLISELNDGILQEWQTEHR